MLNKGASINLDLKKQLKIYQRLSLLESALATNKSLTNSAKFFFDVIVELEFIGARQSATTRSILFPSLAV